MREAVALARKVAVTDASVLLTGETGTGKDVFARAIHGASSRAKENFVAVNCAAFTKELLESELFGHKAGAFTGALKDKKGLLDEADGGTLFLDEIGEMAVDLQAKLLRVLENGNLSVSAKPRRPRLISALSPLRTGTYRTRSGKGISGRTCSTDCRFSLSGCRRCRSGSKI